MDLILGRFADQFIEQLDETALDRFEELLQQNDRDLLQWFIDECPTPTVFDTDLFAKIRSFANLNFNPTATEKIDK